MLANSNAKVVTDLLASPTASESSTRKAVPACALCRQAYPWETTCQLSELVTCPNEPPRLKTAPTR
jgi:hypothetical protein